MKVAVIGAGFTGLAAAYALVKSGAKVTVFEKSDIPGGLALGFRDSTWEWPLEAHYHHLFTSDSDILGLAGELAIPVDFTRPKTSTYSHGMTFQLDSPLSLLRFPYLGLTDRLRTGIGLAAIKFNPFWQPFERITAKSYITAVMGYRSWTEIWEPLFTGKFGSHTDSVSAAWFWARIYKRSPSLGYPRGGFQHLADSLAKKIIGLGGEILYGQNITQITSGPTVHLNNQKILSFDSVICTLPFAVFTSLAPDLPAEYIARKNQFSSLGAVNLVLALRQQFLTDGTYWLNINDRSHPYLAVVEHTNLIDPSHYGGDRLLYVGNYLPADHAYFHKSASQLQQIFLPHLQKINPDFNQAWIRQSWIQKAPFAQPIVTRGYSRIIPPLATPLKGIYLANMQQVYPWDRGTNYAVKIGYNAAHQVLAQA